MTLQIGSEWYLKTRKLDCIVKIVSASSSTIGYVYTSNYGIQKYGDLVQFTGIVRFRKFFDSCKEENDLML